VKNARNIWENYGKIWENIDNIIYDNIWKIYGEKTLET